MIRVATVAIVLVAVLAGCASPRQAPPDPESAWQQRQGRLQALEHWQADGRLAVRLEADGGQAGFSWTQAGPDYRLRLTGPWGQGGAVLEVGEGEAVLDAGEGRRYRGRSARALLASVYGWDIPVAGLRYWLVGLPGEGDDYSLDRFGRLERVRWRGWQITYASYGRIEDVSLPTDIRVSRGANTEVKVVIDEWSLDSAGDDDGEQIESPVPLMGN